VSVGNYTAQNYNQVSMTLPDGQVIVLEFGYKEQVKVNHRPTQYIYRNGYDWVETPIETYLYIPTAEVLSSLEKAQSRNIFDYFTVATIEKSKDPILLGRIEGSEKRFFIGLW
jgi:hypothetical protein